MIRLTLENRSHTPIWLNLCLPLMAVAATLVLCSGLILLAGANVITAYEKLFLSALSTRFNLVETLVKATPMIFTGLAVTVAFRARFWNIGAEGQLLAGAMAAAFVGAREALPAWSLCPTMILAGAVAGALWAMIPAVLKSRFKVDDVVASLLLNFIIFYGMMALLDGPWKDPLSGYPDSPDIRMDAEFPILLHATRLHLGVLLAGIASFGTWLLMRRTTLGFGIQAVGENSVAARYAGFSVTGILLTTAAVSGALAGLAGVGEVAGLHFQVMAGISPGYGYTGIVIAMLARLNPLGVIPAAVFFAIIITGAEAMSRATGVPVFLADVIQGTALIAMLVALLFTRYRIRIRRFSHA
ncbi:ABC transporter permease [Desulfosarcina ovata subsp. sediminis]|uniref:ABC transporter permease n=1 Tax=Desulfosarcina ovata subsp. sediminis TaxID=885957 RepID=A0A5K7ZUG3_9BACT|nr:ABC transporter permease [Desulfosarcina ovata]BBO83862.1 ABC transporter permease [Desulfosarcina ovata subsp. sediminis]